MSLWLWEKIQTMSRPASVIPVVAGIIINARQEILVAQRPAHASHPGFWEFPGGKIEFNETPQQALIREFHEEIGIQILDARPFMQVEYEYPNRTVKLNVWQIEKYLGEPYGAEGQLIRWITFDILPTLTFPAANNKIIEALLIKYKN